MSPLTNNLDVVELDGGVAAIPTVPLPEHNVNVLVVYVAAVLVAIKKELSALPASFKNRNLKSPVVGY